MRAGGWRWVLVLPSAQHSLGEQPEPGSQPLGGSAGPRTRPLLGSSRAAERAWPRPTQLPQAGGSKQQAPQKPTNRNPFPSHCFVKKKIKNGHQHLLGEEKIKWRCQALAAQEQGASTPGPDAAAPDEASSKKQQQTRPLCNG